MAGWYERWGTKTIIKRVEGQMADVVEISYPEMEEKGEVLEKICSDQMTSELPLVPLVLHRQNASYPHDSNGQDCSKVGSL